MAQNWNENLFSLSLFYVVISFYWEIPEGQYKRMDIGIQASENVRTSIWLGKGAERERNKGAACSYKKLLYLYYREELSVGIWKDSL